MRTLIRFLSIAGVVVAIAWIIFAPGFEPILTGIASLVALLGSFVGGGEKTTPSEQSPSGLSEAASTLLGEIDASEESKAKGISLMMIDSVMGGYRPYLWNNHLHGAINVGIADISDVLQAVDELEDRGFLVVHHAEGSLRQWRRTAKQP
jgi:hypothetical protein